MENLFRTNDPAEARRYFIAKASFSTGPGELHTALESGRRPGVDFNLIDVRSAEDYAQEHIPGATNLPQDQWRSFKGLATDKLNLVYCYTRECHLAARAAVEFTGAGYSVMEVDGGIDAWKNYGYATEGSSPGLTRSRPPTRASDLNEGRFMNESIL